MSHPGRHVSHLITSMFLHRSWLHLLGNMWLLWLFGHKVGDSMGRTRFGMSHLLCGLAAGLLEVAVTPSSGVPMVGASGAISGIMGGYSGLYPRVRVFAIVPVGFFLTSTLDALNTLLRVADRRSGSPRACGPGARFNWATALPPWKPAVGRGRLAETASFNWATASPPWKPACLTIVVLPAHWASQISVSG